jgi:hypothetical protein
LRDRLEVGLIRASEGVGFGVVLLVLTKYVY